MSGLKFQKAGMVPKTADATGKPSIFDVNPKKTRGVDYVYEPNIVTELAFGMMPGAGIVEGIINASKRGKVNSEDVISAASDIASIIPGSKFLAKAATKAAPYVKNAARNIKNITEPVYLYGEQPLIDALPKHLTKNVESVGGAYRFQNPTTYGGKTFNPGDVIEESSARVRMSMPQYLKNQSAIKEALKKTGQDSALAYTENPLALKRSDVIKEVGTSPVEMVRKHGVTGASKVGNATKAIKNLGTSGLNVSLGNIFQNPKDAAASLIFKRQGGLIYKSGGWIKSAIKKPGSLTASAKRAGMSISEYCTQGNLSTKSKQRCNLAKTLKGFKK